METWHRTQVLPDDGTLAAMLQEHYREEAIREGMVWMDGTTPPQRPDLVRLYATFLEMRYQVEWYGAHRNGHLSAAEYLPDRRPPQPLNNAA